MLQDELLNTEVLTATLAHLDVHYLRTAKTAAPVVVDANYLITALAQHPLPRVRETLIPLFLRHPEYAMYVSNLVETLPLAASETLRHFYTTAVYLQRLWLGKLEMYLGNTPLLPDYFGQSEWNLPAPTKHYGEAGLRLLAEYHHAQTGDNWLSTYETVMALYLTQLRLKAND